MSSSSSSSSSTLDAKRPKLDSTLPSGSPTSSSTSSSTGIVTHSGTFHADEALAVHLLRTLADFKALTLTRTRDPELIQRARIVVDVGAEYDEARNRFDHHQRGFEEVFDVEHKTKLSSAGLVWKHFGQAILSQHLSLPLEDSRVRLLWNKLYDDFIEAIDGIDNGIPQYPSSSSPAYKSKTDLSSRIGYLNPSWNQSATPQEMDQRFERASAMAGAEFFDRVDYTFHSWLPAREIVEKAMAVRAEKGGDPKGRILVFDEFASWKDHLFTLEKEQEQRQRGGGEVIAVGASDSISRILYVVYPDEAGKWRIQAVPETADSFTSRKPLPELWRGVRDQQLSEVSGIPGAIFVHASGFIGGNQTRQGALQMAQKALEL